MKTMNINCQSCCFSSSTCGLMVNIFPWKVYCRFASVSLWNVINRRITLTSLPNCVFQILFSDYFGSWEIACNFVKGWNESQHQDQFLRWQYYFRKFCLDSDIGLIWRSSRRLNIPAAIFASISTRESDGIKCSGMSFLNKMGIPDWTIACKSDIYISNFTIPYRLWKD